MSGLGSLLRRAEGDRILFWCPGCNESHMIRVGGTGAGPGWTWNGDKDKPTFNPSIKVTTTRIEGGDDELDRILAEYDLPAEREAALADKRIAWCCHSFVVDGHIQFLGDCTHAMAGQTIPLPPFPEGEE